MKDRCLEALGDKTPFGVEAYDGGIAYVFLIKWWTHQKTLYGIWYYVITMKLQKIKINK